MIHKGGTRVCLGVLKLMELLKHYYYSTISGELFSALTYHPPFHLIVPLKLKKDWPHFTGSITIFKTRGRILCGI
jgi:hypothetical protein